MTNHVLLVDDTATVRFKYKALLGHAGFVVDAVEGGRQALALLQPGHPYDLVISDLRMPDMDGFGLVKEIRKTERLKMLPVLMLTGSDDENDLVTNLDAGVSDYLLKSCGQAELIARVRNLCRMKSLQDELERASQTDQLTGLYNRRYGVERLNEEIERSRRYGRDVSVVLLDIDHFKQINDTLGHQAGDEVLQEISSQLDALSRSTDCVIRWGGEEFLFVFPETSTHDAAGIVERLREHLECHPVRVSAQDGTEVPVTVSGGVATLDVTDTLETLVDRADQALYRAKEEGRNQLRLHIEGAIRPAA